jgi:alpha-tubulin suppressor-like RCC1 family protein
MGILSTPADVIGISTATAVTVGYRHFCALLRDGAVLCWGDNASGQLGNGTTTSSSTPQAVPGVRATAIAAGALYTCAVLFDGTMKCWGNAFDGALGNGAVSYAATPNPVAVPGVSGAIAVAAGYTHTCAVLADHTMRCWGNNFYGQLGNGMRNRTPAAVPSPVKVSGIASAVTVTAGFDYTCARLIDGTFKCWGHNTFGQLTNGTTTDSPIPVP